MVVSGLPARVSGPAARLGQIGSSQDGPRDKSPRYADSGIVGVHRIAALGKAGRVETDGGQQSSVGQPQEWRLILGLGVNQVEGVLVLRPPVFVVSEQHVPVVGPIWTERQGWCISDAARH